MTPLIVDVLRANDLFYGHYVEPFAGGAGIACRLLLEGYVSHIHINDLDPAIFSFWKSILTETDRFCSRIERIPATIEEWKKQRRIQRTAGVGSFALGFSTFFLNRTNRSGIIAGGVIGGLSQVGDYSLDCRFNREDLIRKIRRLAARRDQITLTRLEARTFLDRLDRRRLPKTLVNIDPPYYRKGPYLYQSSYKPRDHERLASKVSAVRHLWMVTYDDLPETRALYSAYRCFSQELNYSAQVKRLGAELLVLGPGMKTPACLLGQEAA